MKITVFGASGRTGREVVRQALAAGHDVTAFVRDPAKLSVHYDKVSMIKGDVSDSSAVMQGIEGQDAVVSALGAVNPMKFDPNIRCCQR